MIHPTLQLLGFSGIVLAHHAVCLCSEEGWWWLQCMPKQWNNSSTKHCWTPKTELERHQTQEQNLRIRSPKLLFFLQHSATKVLCNIKLNTKLFTFYKTSKSLTGCDIYMSQECSWYQPKYYNSYCGPVLHHIEDTLVTKWSLPSQ